MEQPAILASEQRRALDRLSVLKGTQEFYLAGGSAVALHVGHRQSRDLDFFSLASTANLDEVRRMLPSAFSSIRVLSETDAALRLECDGARIDFVAYPYPPLETPMRDSSGIQVAGRRDLGVMKLSAIARRGLRRDFWDLRAIIGTGLTLGDLGRDYVQRFGVSQSDLYHVARALTFFADAERDPAFPAGMNQDLWHEVKAYFQARGPDLLPIARPAG